jgi:hypothetical protein
MPWDQKSGERPGHEGTGPRPFVSGWGQPAPRRGYYPHRQDPLPVRKSGTEPPDVFNWVQASRQHVHSKTKMMPRPIGRGITFRG